jgi:2-aminoadipate transaminase
MNTRPHAGGFQLAARMNRVSPSAVREILKVADQPDVLSFAGGLPAPELFPVEEIAQAYAETFAQEGRQSLQYSVTEGHGPLREWIAARLGSRGVPTSVDEVLITSGSQQGVDLVSRLLLDRGDRVIVENPTYLAGLQSFDGYEAMPVAVPSDAQGLCVDGLDVVLDAQHPALIYLVPDFQNPAGTTLAADRRAPLMELARRHGVPVLEDDPYGEIRFAGRPAPMLAALDPDQVIQLGTFSKTLVPGIRLGWIRASREIIGRLTILKQAADLHTSTLSQRAVARLLETFDYDAHLEVLRGVYRSRCTAMNRALARAMPREAQWVLPEGGLFLWVRLPPGIQDDDVFRAAIARRVAVVPGHAFFVGQDQHTHIRLSFSNRSEELIESGMAMLGAAVNELVPVEPPAPRRAPPQVILGAPVKVRGRLRR